MIWEHDEDDCPQCVIRREQLAGPRVLAFGCALLLTVAACAVAAVALWWMR